MCKQHLKFFLIINALRKQPCVLHIILGIKTGKKPKKEFFQLAMIADDAS